MNRLIAWFPVLLAIIINLSLVLWIVKTSPNLAQIGNVTLYLVGLFTLGCLAVWSLSKAFEGIIDE